MRRGTSTFRLHTGIGIGVSGGSTYTVSAYVRLSSASSGQALTFGLACVTSAGTRLGWSYTPTLALVGEQTWQYVEGQTTVPPPALRVVGSPKLTLSGMARHEVVNVDEMTLRPYRAALVIGAHGNIADSGASAYDATDWLETNHRLGPLQSDKIFFDGSTPLPQAGRARPTTAMRSSSRCQLVVARVCDRLQGSGVRGAAKRHSLPDCPPINRSSWCGGRSRERVVLGLFRGQWQRPELRLLLRATVGQHPPGGGGRRGHTRGSGGHGCEYIRVPTRGLAARSSPRVPTSTSTSPTTTPRK